MPHVVVDDRGQAEFAALRGIKGVPAEAGAINGQMLSRQLSAGDRRLPGKLVLLAHQQDKVADIDPLVGDLLRRRRKHCQGQIRLALFQKGGD